MGRRVRTLQRTRSPVLGYDRHPPDKAPTCVISRAGTQKTTATPRKAGRHTKGGAPHPPQPSKKRVLGRPCGTRLLQRPVSRGTTFTQQNRCARLDLEGDLVHEVPHQQNSSARDGLEPRKRRTVTGETFTEGAVGLCLSHVRHPNITPAGPQIGLDRVLVCGITVIDSVRAGFGDGKKDVVDTTAAQSTADEEGVEDVAYDGHRVRLSGERYREQGVHASTSRAPDRSCARHVKEPSRGPSR